MALAVADAQDEIAYLVYGKAWSAIGADFQAQATSMGGLALTEIEGWADLFDMGGSGSNAPAAWKRWLALKTAALITEHRDQSRADNFTRQAQAAMRSAIETIGAGESDASASTVTFTLEQVRRFVFIRCARRQVYPTIQEIDHAIQSVLHHAYNASLWRFRRLLVRLNLAADGTVTLSKRDGANGWEDLGATQKFDMLATRALYADADAADSSVWSVSPSLVKFATADEFARLSAQDADATGKPCRFRIEGMSSGDYVWHFWPFPDQAMVYYCEIFLEGPQAALGDTSFAEFPPAFQPILRDSVLLRVLEDRGRADRDLRDRVLHQQERLLQDYEDAHGPADDFGGPVDVYNDVWGTIGGGV